MSLSPGEVHVVYLLTLWSYDLDKDASLSTFKGTKHIGITSDMEKYLYCDTIILKHPDPLKVFNIWLCFDVLVMESSNQTVPCRSL